MPLVQDCSTCWPAVHSVITELRLPPTGNHHAPRPMQWWQRRSRYHIGLVNSKWKLLYFVVCFSSFCDICLWSSISSFSNPYVCTCIYYEPLSGWYLYFMFLLMYLCKVLASMWNWHYKEMNYYIIYYFLLRQCPTLQRMRSTRNRQYPSVIFLFLGQCGITKKKEIAYWSHAKPNGRYFAPCQGMFITFSAVPININNLSQCKTTKVTAMVVC